LPRVRPRAQTSWVTEVDSDTIGRKDILERPTPARARQVRSARKLRQSPRPDCHAPTLD
jgi:hypothetical protein